jgi:hypothetical protein
MIKATNKHTGEIVELPVDTYEQIIASWQIAQEYEKVSKKLKDQLKELVPKYVNEVSGLSEERQGLMFRVSNIQRKNYDKSVLIEKVHDEGLLFEMLKPDKKFIDDYLKENLESIGDLSTELRNSMIDEGNPYQVIKLEKLEREK